MRLLSGGTLGNNGFGLSELMASATSLPALTCCRATWMGRNMTLTCPATTSVTAPAVPLYGMCVSAMPMRCLKSSIARWCGVPLPGEA